MVCSPGFYVSGLVQPGQFFVSVVGAGGIACTAGLNKRNSYLIQLMNSDMIGSGISLLHRTRFFFHIFHIYLWKSRKSAFTL